MNQDKSLESALSEICVQCGMCCDGTLFGHANLASEEDEALAVSLGMRVKIGDQEQRQFMLPCHHFCEKCTVYDQQRPKICGSFFCAPLHQVKNGKRSVSSAQDLILKIKELRDRVLADLLKYENLSELSLFEAFDTLRKNQKTALQAYPDLWLKFIGLNHKLNLLRAKRKK